MATECGMIHCFYDFVCMSIGRHTGAVSAGEKIARCARQDTTLRGLSGLYGRKNSQLRTPSSPSHYTFRDLSGLCGRKKPAKPAKFAKPPALSDLCGLCGRKIAR
jgi:hypothetical protein